MLDPILLLKKIKRLEKDVELQKQKPFKVTKAVANQHLLYISDTLDADMTITNFALRNEGKTSIATVYGKNLLDKATFRYGRIKNDEGNEISDSSHYFMQMIPVVPGEAVCVNFDVQRVYYYDADRQWIRRSATYGPSEFRVLVIPENCYFIQIQVPPLLGDAQLHDYMQVERGTSATDYQPFVSQSISIDRDTLPASRLRTYAGATTVFIENSVEITVEIFATTYTPTIPSGEGFGVWEPEFTTNDYAVPPHSTRAALDLSYVDFLETFYDPYLGTHGDYVVSKKSLGHDSGGLETWEYAFTPRHYAHTVLITAGMHACEISPIFGCAFFVRHLMEQTEPGMKWLRDNVRFRVIPVLCPSSFDQNPKIYGNANGVNINRNFNHLDSWTQMGTGSGSSYKGEAPDSEPETKLLKTWLANYAQEADFWIDCHSMYSAGGGNPNVLHYVLTSDVVTSSIIRSAQQRITDYYIDKGLFNPGDTPAHDAPVARLILYPKHLYAYDVYGLRSIMIEQAMDSQWYGGDTELNGDDGDIRNYVLMLRMYILAMLSNSQAGLEFDFEDVMWFVYQQYKAQRGRV